ncbi:hypothetical protein Tco_0759252, partial [Tanacetum coccineum]
MDDEPIWAVDRVVASTPGPAITIPETANEFAIKGNHLTLVKGNQFDGRIKTDPHKHVREFLGTCSEIAMVTISPKAIYFKIFYHGLNETTHEALNAAVGGIFLYKTPNQAYQLLEEKVLIKLDWAKNKKPKPSLKKTVAFIDEGTSNFDTNKIMARTDVITMKIDDQYKEIQTRTKCNHCGGNNSTTDCNDDDTPMSREEEAKFMQTFQGNNSTTDCNDDDTPMSREEEAKFMQTFQAKFDWLADKQSARPSRSLPSNTQPNPKVGKFAFPMDFIILKIIDVIDEILEEYFDALLDEENYESDSDKEEIPFEKITFDTDYKIKKSLDEPPTDLELKLLPDHLEYAFLEDPSFLHVIISSQLFEQNKNKLVFVLKKHKQAFAWKITDIPIICECLLVYVMLPLLPKIYASYLSRYDRRIRRST